MTSNDELRGKLSPGDPFFGIVQEAYRLFAGPKPTVTDVCDCCMDKEVERDFFRPPIRDLPAAYVQDWYFAAYDPAGISKQTWSYLLPRILEMLAVGTDVSTMSLEVNLGRFDTGNPDNWSPKQWDVLDRFQRAYLRRAIEVGPNPIDDVLCMFRLGGWPLSDLLNQVFAMPTATLAERFWKDWCKDHVVGREGVWVTTFWKGEDNKAVYEFYTSHELHERIAALALAEELDCETRRTALAVATVIENEATWTKN